MAQKQESYENFKNRVYGYIIEYKEAYITKDCGTYRGEEYKVFLPEMYWNEKLPRMLFDGIKDTVTDIQKSVYKYKPHLFAFMHIASSQTACVNLFVPIMESQMVNEILMSVEVCPKDFKCVAREQLYHGYQFEFWGTENNSGKGLLGDHSRGAGTDSDIAIAYYNNCDELCLWLIEHKLTERGFTSCGGYRSKVITQTGKKNCQKCSTSDIMRNPGLCHYHQIKYEYWNIMNDCAKDFFAGKPDGEGCPFRGGLNQLWRNQLLAIALEQQGRYKTVSFSVVHHPENNFLDKTMNEYEQLVQHSPKFSHFTSVELIEAAKQDPELESWIDWYRRVYYGEKR